MREMPISVGGPVPARRSLAVSYGRRTICETSGEIRAEIYDMVTSKEMGKQAVLISMERGGKKNRLC